MGKNTLQDTLRERLEGGLPGEAAQYLMAPGERPGKSADPALSKWGGVLILIYPHNNEWHTILTQRAEYPGVHSGQVSFPGGRMEHLDKDLSMTALRETEEETGVPASDVVLLGELTRLYIPPSNFMVYPFVGFMSYKPAFNRDPVEVEAVIEVPLSRLVNEEIQHEGPIELSNGKTIVCPYFDIQGYVVWGATAMILSEFISLLTRPAIINFDTLWQRMQELKTGSGKL